MKLDGVSPDLLNRPRMINVLLLSLITTIGYAQKGADAIDDRPDFKSFFDEQGIEGSILVYDMQNDTYTGYDVDRIQTGYSPASTFKIFNSLVALETGAVKTENDTIRWDGKEKGRPQWNKDHNMRSAFRYSVVWFYQELARRAGSARMKHYIDLTGYGNNDMSGGIDMFWLKGGLRISSMQQIAFLRRLYANDLPFSQRTMEIVKDIMIMERTDAYVLRAKTGWTAEGKPEIGWFVGYVERDGKVYFFSTNINVEKPEDVAAREAVTRKVLQTLDILPK